MTTSSKLEAALKKETISIIVDVKENVCSKECFLNKCHGILIVKTYWDTHNGFNAQRSCLAPQMIDYSFAQQISVSSFEKIKTRLTNWICRVGFLFAFVLVPHQHTSSIPPARGSMPYLPLRDQVKSGLLRPKAVRPRNTVGMCN